MAKITHCALPGLAPVAPTTASAPLTPPLAFADVITGRPIAAPPAPPAVTPAISNSNSTPTSALGGLSELSELIALLRGINLTLITSCIKQAIEIFRGPGTTFEKLLAIIPLIDSAFP